MTQTAHFPKAIAPAIWPIFNIISFLEYLVFFRSVFSTEQFQYSCRMVFRLFLTYLSFDPNCPFWKSLGFSWAIACARWPIFNSILFLEYLVFFRAVFLHRTTLLLLQNEFSHVFGIFNFWLKLTILQRIIAFAWAIAFARYPLLKIVSFLEYLAFFRAVFCTEQL